MIARRVYSNNACFFPESFEAIFKLLSDENGFPVKAIFGEGRGNYFTSFYLANPENFTAEDLEQFLIDNGYSTIVCDVPVILFLDR